MIITVVPTTSLFHVELHTKLIITSREKKKEEIISLVPFNPYHGNYYKKIQKNALIMHNL